MKIVIAGSSKFLKEIYEWKEKFEAKGYEVINYTKDIDALNLNTYQNAHKSFFKSLNETDELFVVNEEKNGIKGYIGSEVFAEISFVIANNLVKGENKKVYLLNMPDKKLSSYFELDSFIKLGYIEIWRDANGI